MAIRPPKKLQSFPALRLKQNNHQFYFATIPIDDLFPSCFVARREEDPMSGFQRALSENRADDIAKYLSSGTGSIPSNIVLSAQSIADFVYSARSKTISFRSAPYAFLVLDGQHRLWGYHKSSVRHRVPVAIYSGLSRNEEAKLFIDINTTQRGVPAALLLDIKQVAQTESSTEQSLRTFFDRLNDDAESPLAGKLSSWKSTTNKISRVTFNRALGPVLSGSLLAEMPEEQRYKLLRNYLNAFDAEIGNKDLLVRSAFFEAIFAIFDAVTETSLSQSRNLKQDSLQRVVRPLAKLNYQGTGGKALLDKRAITTLMQSALKTKKIIGEDML